MTTDFTNKYMQVFQTYDEFGEHSADYVKGEDHVAFLIEENEVIYWLYLEQVWRPLNVRTTTTGELEDGRTKVAVKLEYVEGGQKYTSVPNIPDPERITSMSHFLEDYPDIEEVNVSGTVNLTDLSYAFANSNIKDFNLLDTSNVDNMQYCLSDINNNELEVVTFSNVNCNISHILDNSTIKSFTYNGTVTDDSYFDNVTAEKLIVNTEQEITELNRALMRITNGCDIPYIKGLNIQLSEENGVNTLELVEAKEISYDYNGSSYNNFKVKCDSFDLYPRKDNINICNQIDVTEVTILNIFKTAQAKFGKGIKYLDTVNFNIKHNNLNNYIGNFIFTTPIVNDDFYNKYKQYNIPISIFQYKTTFEEVADVKITEALDSNLLYINWRSIDFDLSNTSIEIYTNIDINTNYYSGTIKKLVIDNSTVDGISKNNCPYLHDFYSNRFKVTEGYISGIFKSYNPNDGGLARISESKLLKNITLVDFTFMKLNNGDFLKTNNIKFDYVKNIKYTTISVYGNKQTELDTLINDGVININLRCKIDGNDAYRRRIKNIDGIIFNIGNDIESSITNIYFIIDLLFEHNNNIINSTIRVAFGTPEDVEIDDSVYINGQANLIMFYNSNYPYNSNNYIKYIYGDNLTITIDYATTNIDRDWNESPYKHVDVFKTVPSSLYSESHILNFIHCDNETNINLITKLVDNTSSDKKTIYMYRTQANIIGEKNIAAAVAKNYEIAIIEN